ncbi:MAG: MerR family transcriptional regulator [Tatlockia sp.]|nr:MerR family transcriptional regulator [Tatlockia sp.]
MAQWYIKELGKLTNVSVQTLHHYDRIDLLKPSLRLPNGYRLYSENDLSKLQQIIALKFFGFSLSQIKTLLSKHVDLIDHFAMQSSLLEKKAETLFEASQTLKNIIADCSHGKSIPWKTIIQLIEVYRMTEALEKTWMGKTLTPEELQEYVNFEQEVITKLAEKEKKSFEKGWVDLVKEVNSNLKQDPTNALGISLGERCMEWVNSYYGRKYASLRTTIWEKGIKEGHLSEEIGLSIEAAQWLDKAMDAYVKQRTSTILNLIESYPHEAVLKRWEDMLVDYFGDDQGKKNDFCLMLLNDNQVPKVAKDWVKGLAKIH